jgi:deoxyribodipyrimidine photolyase-related protein
VTRADALLALEDFVAHRLPLFGPYEDAMWTDEPFVYHSALSPLLNVKLLSPRQCVEAALAAYSKGAAPLQSVEAFVRQLIGWREYIRGVYDREGAAYEARNYLGHYGRLPHFYWTGDTDMACVRECVTQVVDRAFGHHIQRLMVLGNFALTAGVHPREVSDWFLAMYADGVDWATLPNALGMAMHADGTDTKGPVVGTKPYAASGAYVSRMSNYCTKCRYDPAKRDGPDACPLTVFYWDFLRRHRARFERNPRMAQIIRNLDRFGEPAVTRITISARSLRERFGVGDIDVPREPFREHATKDYSGSAAREAAGPAAPLFEGSRG